ncbi:MAG: type II secretion system protein [Burkholderiaceae bacterium]
MKRRPIRGRPEAGHGIVLVGLLIVMAFSAALAMSAAEVWATSRQRERELELLFVGDQYRQAIRRYYFAVPKAQARVLPARLEDLLLDERFPVPVRHLRRLYPDPITGSTEWGLAMRGERIVGVHSLSPATPIKQAGFGHANAVFEARSAYREWVFLFVPPAAAQR